MVKKYYCDICNNEIEESKYSQYTIGFYLREDSKKEYYICEKCARLFDSILLKIMKNKGK